MTSAVLRRIGATMLGILLGLTGVVVSAVPAHADRTRASGYVWAYDPTAPSYTIPRLYPDRPWPNLYYARNSAGGPVTVTRLDVGTYRVSFGGLGALLTTGGVAHAVANATTSNLCTVGSWVRAGDDLNVRVNCFAADGTRADTLFLANFVAATGDGSKYSYLWADQPTPAAGYTPAWYYSYDPTGEAPWVIRDRQGSYRAYLPESAGETTTTFYQTTAYGSAAVSCSSAAYLGGGQVRILCHDVAGGLVDSRFSVTWARQNLLQQIAPTDLIHVHATVAGASVTWRNEVIGDPIVVTRLAVGSYKVRLPEIGDIGHAVAYAASLTGRRCAVLSFDIASPDELVYVSCVNRLGVPTDTDFYVGFTW